MSAIVMITTPAMMAIVVAPRCRVDKNSRIAGSRKWWRSVRAAPIWCAISRYCGKLAFLLLGASDPAQAAHHRREAHLDDLGSGLDYSKFGACVSRATQGDDGFTASPKRRSSEQTFPMLMAGEHQTGLLGAYGAAGPVGRTIHNPDRSSLA